MFFKFYCQGTELLIKHYTTKCKVCFSSTRSFVYNKKENSKFLKQYDFNFIDCSEKENVY